MKKIFNWLSLFLIPFASVLQADEVLEEEHPIVILGGGVSAMTAGTYLARGGIVPIIITGPTVGGTITQSHNVQNWPGELSISGIELSERVKTQAETNGAILQSEIVISVDLTARPFVITTKKLFDQSGQSKKYKARSLIIALGATPNLLNIPGETNYWSRGVYSCAVCDGALYKDKIVAVVGGGDSALTETHYLSNLAKQVHVFVRRDQFRSVEKERMKEILSRPNVVVHYNSVIDEIRGDQQKVTHLRVHNTLSQDNQQVPVDALFLAIGARPNTDLFQGQLDLDERGYIQLQEHQETSIEGVYAVGDVADPEFKQVISAAGDAAKAALQAQKYLVSYVAPVKEPSVAEKIHTAQTIIDITSKDQFTKELRNNKGPVFVDFYSTHCGPCRMFSPIFDAWAKEYGNKIKFLKVNADKCGDVFEMYQVHVVPTLIIFDEKGNIVRKSSGFKEISEVDRRLEKFKGKSDLVSQDFK